MHLQRSLNILPAAHSNLSPVRIVKTGLLGLDTLLSLSLPHLNLFPFYRKPTFTTFIWVCDVPT